MPRVYIEQLGQYATFPDDTPQADMIRAIEGAIAQRQPSLGSQVADVAGNVLAGAARGAGSIGATLLTPVDAAVQALNDGKPLTLDGIPILGRDDRRQAMDEGLKSMGADPESLAYQAGKFGAEVAGTAGAGGALGQGAARVGLPGLAAALQSGGLMGTGALTRIGGGALAGGAAGGLIDPEQAGVGALVGGGLGGAAAGIAGLARGVSPERLALARQAAAAGIKVPIDRIMQNNVLDRVAGGLEYLPLSGREAALDVMERGVQGAAAATVGETGTNIRDAITSARARLGPEFNRIAESADIPDSPRLRAALDRVQADVTDTLPAGQDQVLLNQIQRMNDHLATGGYIPGATTLKLKQNLDRISKQAIPGPLARDLRSVLFDELAQPGVLGPDDFAKYADARRQWGNLKALEKIETRDAEGAVSMARLGNMNVRRTNPDLGAVADLASNFGRARASPHSLNQQNMLGALLTLGAGAGAGMAGVLPHTALAAAAALAGGRATNMALNSDLIRNALLGLQQRNQALPAAMRGVYRFAPSAAAALGQ